jgi:energy-coupling factor transport system permease protein
VAERTWVNLSSRLRTAVDLKSYGKGRTSVKVNSSGDENVRASRSEGSPRNLSDRLTHARTDRFLWNIWVNRNLSSLDPRSKLIGTLAAAVILMGLHQGTSLVIALAVLIGTVLLFHLGRSWLDLLKALSFPVVSFSVIAWVAFDLTAGVVAGLRLLTLGTVFFLFFQTTSPESISNSLVKMGIPYPFAFVLSASMQFIPVLVRRAASIRDAQRSRGIPLDSKLGTVRHLPALVGPMLIQAFKLADELAESMEARGFGAPGRRFRNEPHFKGVDWLVVVFSLAALGIFFWLR